MIEVAPLQVSTLCLFKDKTYRGRCLVAYHGHVNELFELAEAELARFMQDVAQAARALKTAFNPATINYAAYSDKLPHLHLHLVPKYVDGPAWGTPFTLMPDPQQRPSEPAYAVLIAALRLALRA
jgi:diadenosine tetraphosphate (Ap4A) HIT family hydrolase